tara:strand:+ start:643 stop:1059 length:417 start_codon:yes stop_codon:yes gene_type:complete
LSNDISEKDKKDWNKFISSKDKLPNKDFLNVESKIDNTRSIDLHGYTLDNANKVIEEFISKSFSENVKKLIVITGKGLHSEKDKNPYVSKDLSILKHSVPKFIANSKNLMKMINYIEEAKIEDGGGGAFYIYLKKKTI